MLKMSQLLKVKERTRRNRKPKPRVKRKQKMIAQMMITLRKILMLMTKTMKRRKK